MDFDERGRVVTKGKKDTTVTDIRALKSTRESGMSRAGLVATPSYHLLPARTAQIPCAAAPSSNMDVDFIEPLLAGENGNASSEAEEPRSHARYHTR